MTIAPEIQSLIDWGKRVNEAHSSLPIPELRDVVRDELDHELRRRGVTVEPVGTTSDERIAVAGGEIRIRLFVPAGAGPHPVFVHFHGGGFVFGAIAVSYTHLDVYKRQGLLRVGLPGHH